MLRGGIEPPRPFGPQLLILGCLPVSSPEHIKVLLNFPTYSVFKDPRNKKARNQLVCRRRASSALQGFCLSLAHLRQTAFRQIREPKLPACHSRQPTGKQGSHSIPFSQSESYNRIFRPVKNKFQISPKKFLGVIPTLLPRGRRN